MRLIALIYLLIAPSWAISANWSFQQQTFPSTGEVIGFIELSGDIVEGDYENYLSTFEWIKGRVNRVAVITLNSNGGLVDEAIKIGKHIRKNRIFTSVKPGEECYSSCALIFFSGLSRKSQLPYSEILYELAPKTKFSRVGVHRSYIKNPSNMSFSKMEKTLGESHDLIANFLRDMRTPERIIEEIFSTSSAEIKQLLDIPNDRLYDEYILSRCGNMWVHSVEKMSKVTDTSKMMAENDISAERWGKCAYKAGFDLQLEVQKR